MYGEKVEVVDLKNSRFLEVTTSKFVFSELKTIYLAILKVLPGWGQRNSFSKHNFAPQNTDYAGLLTQTYRVSSMHFFNFNITTNLLPSWLETIEVSFLTNMTEGSKLSSIQLLCS